jgi:hypothetical protein
MQCIIFLTFLIFFIIMKVNNYIIGYSNEMQNSLHTNQIKTLINNLCLDFAIPPVLIIPTNNPAYNGCYVKKIRQSVARLFIASFEMSTVLHEFCHHLHECRNPGKADTHNITFHRICFEVRDWVLSAYGIDCPKINHYTHSKAYDKALNEWFISKQNLGKEASQWQK